MIARDKKQLVFIEVKLKIGEEFGNPEDMITISKLNQIKQTAEHFLQTNPKIASSYQNFQIDAVCIVLDKNFNIKRINHWENLEK